ncbi:hypothetical protein ACJIZ3_011610 [Penstemon smallii]|uniref:Uncharacterized protein n=1 Tax=Penstemon smallii TaxID=265156 RepID=A0ABD3UMG9_9LAMI
MSSKGGHAAPHPHPLPSYGGDRFYNPPPVRRYQQILVQQQRHMMDRQQMLQQQQQQQRRMVPEYSVGGGAAEQGKRSDGDDSVRAAATLCVPPSVVAPVSTLKVTNIDRLMESVTPFVTAQDFSEVNAEGLRTREGDTQPFFCLEDLWESFSEWSAYGAGVPLLLNGKDPIEQYYVPFLSGIQLYIDSSKPSSRPNGCSEERDADSYRLTSTEADVANSPRLPFFQYLEREQPHTRRPLADKISLLSSQYPELSKCRSCDLLPTSWICVAWYPIYRIPVGPMLQDLDASFLTFHSLSTQSKNSSSPQFHDANTRKVNGIVDPTAKFSLPVFALASYKLKGSVVSPCGPQECEQEHTLLHAADNWLRNLHVNLPDYQFFRSHYSYRR